MTTSPSCPAHEASPAPDSGLTPDASDASEASGASKAARPTGAAHLPPPPRVDGLPFIGLSHRLYRDAMRVMMDVHRKHGPVVELDVGRGGSMYCVFHPDGVREVFTKGYRRKSSTFYDIFDESLGLIETGDAWRTRRRLLQPFFGKKHLPDLLDPIVGGIADVLEDSWRKMAAAGEPIDLSRELRLLLARVLTTVLFGSSVPADLRSRIEVIEEVLEALNKYLLAWIRLPLSWPTPTNSRLMRSKRVLDDATTELLEHHRRAHRDAPGAKDNLISLLLAAQDPETGERLSYEQVHGEVKGMFVAGVETTSRLLGWSWYLLARHPDEEEKLHAEVAAVLDGRPPTTADLTRLTHTRMVLDESLRLYPTAPLIYRRFSEDHNVCGYRVPAHREVVACPFVTHRSPEFWERPEEFLPRRFAPESWPETARRFAYLPFAHGPHICVGKDLGPMEAQLILAMISQRFRLRLRDTSGIRPLARITLVTSRPLMADIHPVKAG